MAADLNCGDMALLSLNALDASSSAAALLFVAVDVVADLGDFGGALPIAFSIAAAFASFTAFNDTIIVYARRSIVQYCCAFKKK
jgi:hypothetical protein